MVGTVQRRPTGNIPGPRTDRRTGPVADGDR